MLEWRKLADLPPFTRSAALVGETLYAIGPQKRDTVAVDLKTGAVERLPSPKHHSMGATLAGFRDRCLMFGNKGHVMAYDPVQKQWEVAGKLREQMMRTSPAVSGGALYLIGGRQHAGLAAPALRLIERFDLDTGTADSAGTLPRQLSDCQVAVRPDGVIDVIGGNWVESGARLGGARETVMADWITFDPQRGVTDGNGSAPRPVTRGGAVWTSEGLYLLAGDTETVSLYDPTSRQWREQRPLPDSGTYADAFLWDGSLLVAQGKSVNAAAAGPAPAAAPATPPVPVLAQTSGGFVVRVHGDAGPYPTREEAERMALEFLRAGLSAEIRREDA